MISENGWTRVKDLRLDKNNNQSTNPGYGLVLFEKQGSNRGGTILTFQKQKLKKNHNDNNELWQAMDLVKQIIH